MPHYRTPDDVAAAFAALPREPFIPETVWDGAEAVERRRAPERWRALVDADAAVVTQVDGGRAGRRGRPSSSAPAPSVMSRMLEAADLYRGARVLEIGTGTGHNAALLCELTGEDVVPVDNVTTVEVDPELADQARRALARANRWPWVITYDGALGFPPHAPYDRVISTCAVTHIPRRWITQAAPGGLIVTPWTPHPGLPGGLLARLRVDNGVAQGRFLCDLSVMAMRGGEAPEPATTGLDEWPDAEHITGMDPWSMLSPDAVWPLLLTVPDWVCGVRTVDGVPCPWIASTGKPAWARLIPDVDWGWRVEQGGKRRMWDEIREAWRWWRDQGSPAGDIFGMTVDADGHRVWFDRPDGLSWPLPGPTGCG